MGAEERCRRGSHNGGVGAQMTCHHPDTVGGAVLTHDNLVVSEAMAWRWQQSLYKISEKTL